MTVTDPLAVVVVMNGDASRGTVASDVIVRHCNIGPDHWARFGLSSSSYLSSWRLGAPSLDLDILGLDDGVQFMPADKRHY